MAVPIQGVPNAEASLIELSLKREGDGPLMFVSQVQLVNTTSRQSSVIRFEDLPEECVEHLRRAVAVIEAHAGARFFTGII